MDQTNSSPENEQKDEAKTVSPTSLRLIVIAIRRALLGAVKLCDQLVEQLKTK